VTDAEVVSGADQGEAQELRLFPDAGEKFRVGRPEVGEAGVDPWPARGVHEGGETETIDEPADFARRHRFAVEIDEVDGNAALLKEPLGGADGLGILHAEDLDVQHDSYRIVVRARRRPRYLFAGWSLGYQSSVGGGVEEDLADLDGEAA